MSKNSTLKDSVYSNTLHISPIDSNKASMGCGRTGDAHLGYAVVQNGITCVSLS